MGTDTCPSVKSRRSLWCVMRGWERRVELDVSFLHWGPGHMNPEGEFTKLLTAWGKGDQSALNELIPLVYNELHRMARRAWRSTDQAQTLQPTALINEAYLKMVGSG